MKKTFQATSSVRKVSKSIVFDNLCYALTEGERWMSGTPDYFKDIKYVHGMRNKVMTFMVGSNTVKNHPHSIMLNNCLYMCSLVNSSKEDENFNKLFFERWDHEEITDQDAQVLNDIRVVKDIDKKIRVRVMQKKRLMQGIRLPERFNHKVDHLRQETLDQLYKNHVNAQTEMEKLKNYYLIEHFALKYKFTKEYKALYSNGPCAYDVKLHIGDALYAIMLAYEKNLIHTIIKKYLSFIRRTGLHIANGVNSIEDVINQHGRSFVRNHLDYDRFSIPQYEINDVESDFVTVLQDYVNFGESFGTSMTRDEFFNSFINIFPAICKMLHDLSYDVLYQVDSDYLKNFYVNNKNSKKNFDYVVSTSLMANDINDIFKKRIIFTEYGKKKLSIPFISISSLTLLINYVVNNTEFYCGIAIDMDPETHGSSFKTVKHKRLVFYNTLLSNTVRMMHNNYNLEHR